MRDRTRKRSRGRLRGATLPGGPAAKLLRSLGRVRAEGPLRRKAERLIDAE